MTAGISQIINKYQGVASQKVIHAVRNAAARTGADFSFLMEKASVESSFDPAAKSRSSTATAHYQFMESTWLSMVKEHGAKYGLGRFADQIRTRDGKPCVDDCDVKKAILNLRKNPEIAALMAGELSSGNKQYLKSHTDGTVGTTELYLAHFMGAGGAGKFLNSRENDGGAIAAHLFPREARANKNVFFDAATGHARTLDGIYDFFARKFNGGTSAPLHSAPPAEAGSTPSAPAQPMPSSTMPVDVAQALFFFPETNDFGRINWNDDQDSTSGFSRGAQKLSAERLLLMAQMHRNRPHAPEARHQYNA